MAPRTIRLSKLRNSDRARQVALVRQMIRSSRLAHAERKTWFTSQTGQLSTAAGVVWPLSQGCTQGDTNIQRNGNQISLTGIHFRLLNLVGVFNASLRVVLFQDTMATGVFPLVTDVLQTASWLSNYAALQQFEQKRFKILADRSVDVSAAGPSTKTIIVTVPKPLKKVTYLGTTDVQASNGKNAVYAIVIGSTTDMTYAYNFSMQFLDQ